MLVGESEGLLGDLIFARQRCAEHGRVVAVERDHYTVIEIIFRRMIGEAGAEASAKITGKADFHRYLALGKLFDEIRVVKSSKPVADAFDAQVERAPNGFRRPSLAGMRRKAQPVVGRPGVRIPEKLRRRFLLVAADADANDVAVVIADCKLKDFLSGLSAKLADSVEDPHQRDAEVTRAAGTAAIQAFEDGGEILLAPQANANRNVDLGVQNVFFFQPLHQAVSDELVIVCSSQVLGDVLERKQEAGEIFVAIEGVDLGACRPFTAALPQLKQSGWLDRALEVQMQLSLGKKAKKTIRQPIECGRSHFLIVESCLNICEARKIRYFFANSLLCRL